jgi:hypothetical protein
MKTIIFTLAIALLAPLSTLAQTDVCCVMSSESGNKVSTTASYMTPGQCKPGEQTSGKRMCAMYKGDEDTFCSTRSDDNKKLRCNKCGYVWIDGQCYVEDPVELAKKDLEKKEKEKENGSEEKKQYPAVVPAE